MKTFIISSLTKKSFLLSCVVFLSVFSVTAQDNKKKNDISITVDSFSIEANKDSKLEFFPTKQKVKISPMSGSAGTLITIKGSDFTNYKNIKVSFYSDVPSTHHSFTGQIVYSDDKNIVCLIPESAEKDSYQIEVTGYNKAKKTFFVFASTIGRVYGFVVE